MDRTRTHAARAQSIAQRRARQLKAGNARHTASGRARAQRPTP